MPLYELVCIAQRFNTVKNALPLQALLNETSKFVHEAGGCVRRLDYHGLHGLPQRARKDGKWHEHGDLWTMWFDTNPKVLQQLNDRMRTDPRVLRSTTIRKGITLEEVTAALPRSAPLSSLFSETTLTSSPSLHSTNPNYSSTTSYPPPSPVDPNLARKHAEGTTSRAQSQAIQEQESEARRDEQSFA